MPESAEGKTEGVHFDRNSTDSILSELNTRINDLAAQVEKLSAGETTEKKEMHSLLQMAVTLGTVGFALVSVVVIVIGYWNYSSSAQQAQIASTLAKDIVEVAKDTIKNTAKDEVEQTTSSVKDMKDQFTSITESERASLNSLKQEVSDAIHFSDIDSVIISPVDEKADNILVDIYFEKIPIDQANYLYAYKMYFNIDVFMQGHRDHGKYGIGKVIAMNVRSTGPLANILRNDTTGDVPYWTTEINNGYVHTNNNNNPIILSTDLKSLYNFYYSVQRPHCDDLLRLLISLQASDSLGVIYFTPVVENMDHVAEEVPLKMKLGPVHGTYSCDQLSAKK